MTIALPFTIAEVNAIVTLKEFQKPIKEVLHTLQVCDDSCPNEQFSKSVETSLNNDILYLDCYAIDREGHTGQHHSLSSVKTFPA